MNRVCTRLPVFSSLISYGDHPTLEDASAWEPWVMFPKLACLCPWALHCGCPELHWVEGSPQISCVACRHMTNKYTNTNTNTNWGLQLGSLIVIPDWGPLWIQDWGHPCGSQLGSPIWVLKRGPWWGPWFGSPLCAIIGVPNWATPWFLSLGPSIRIPQLGSLTGVPNCGRFCSPWLGFPFCGPCWGPQLGSLRGPSDLFEFPKFLRVPKGGP